MTGSGTDEPEHAVMEMYDDSTDAGLTCRVCGSLVSPVGGYPRAHWDWHETPNGA